MPRFTVELKVTLEMDIEMAPAEAQFVDMKALHEDIAFQAEDVLCRRSILRTIQNRAEDLTGWVSSASTLMAEAKQPSKKYFESLLQSDPN